MILDQEFHFILVMNHHLHSKIDCFSVGNVNPSFIVTPNESSIIGYNYYLPRIDKVVLDDDGELTVLQGSFKCKSNRTNS